MEVYPLSHASLVEAATKDEDVELILVMGESRSGKTKLVNLLSRSNLPVGGGRRSCTNHIQLSRIFEHEDEKVMLIDTPGLEHCTRGESDILKEVANLIADIHRKGRNIRGIIYIQPLNKSCMSATALRNFTLCASLAGESAFQHIVIASTNTDRMGDGLRTKLETRLIGPSWGLSSFITKGATFRSYNNLDSGREILTHILDNEPGEFLVRAEMVDGNKPFHETTVGKLLINGTDMELLYSHEKEMKSIRAENANLKANLLSNLGFGWEWPFPHSPISGRHCRVSSLGNNFLNYPYPTSSSITVCNTSGDCICYNTSLCVHGPNTRCHHCISNRCPVHVPSWMPNQLPSHMCERPLGGQCNCGSAWCSRFQYFQPTSTCRSLHAHRGHPAGCSCCSGTYDHETAYIVDTETMSQF